MWGKLWASVYMGANCTQGDKLSARTLLKQNVWGILFRCVGHPLQVWGVHPLQVWGCILFRCGGASSSMCVGGVASRAYMDSHTDSPRRTHPPEWGGGSA